MKLASHNTFTYLKVRQWWLRPFAFTARCQNEDIQAQVLHGVRMFDLRVRFKRHKVTVCHGLMRYKMSEEELRHILSELNSYGTIWMRVVLECKKPDFEQVTAFYFFCLNLEREYPGIHFFGGNDRSDWECKVPIYSFSNPMPDIDHRYASATKDSFWDDLYPLGYARKHNYTSIQGFDERKWLMLDFIGTVEK